MSSQSSEFLSKSGKRFTNRTRNFRDFDITVNGKSLIVREYNSGDLERNSGERVIGAEWQHIMVSIYERKAIGPVAYYAEI